MKIKYTTKTGIALSLSNLCYALPNDDLTPIYDMDECTSAQEMYDVLRNLLPFLHVTLDKEFGAFGEPGSYVRFRLMDRLGNIDYLKFIY